MDISAEDAQRLTRAAKKFGLISKKATLSWPIRRLYTRYVGETDSPLTNIQFKRDDLTIFLILVEGIRIPVYLKEEQYHLDKASLDPSRMKQMIQMATSCADEGAIAALSGLAHQMLQVSLIMDLDMDIQHQLTAVHQSVIKSLKEYHLGPSNTFQMVSYTIPEHIRHVRQLEDEEDDAEIEFSLYKIDQTSTRQPIDLQDIENLPLLCELMVDHRLIKPMRPMEEAQFKSKLGISTAYEADTMQLRVIRTASDQILRAITQSISGHLVNTRYFINDNECQRPEIEAALLNQHHRTKYQKALEQHLGKHYKDRVFLPDPIQTQASFFTAKYHQAQSTVPRYDQLRPVRAHELFVQIISLFFKYAAWKPIHGQPYHLLIGKDAFRRAHPSLDIDELMTACLDGPDISSVLSEFDQALGLESFLYLSDMIRSFLKRASPLYIDHFLIRDDNGAIIEDLKELAENGKIKLFLDELEFQACTSPKLQAANMLLKYFSYLSQPPFSDLSGTTSDNLFAGTLSTFAPAYGFRQDGWKALTHELKHKYPLDKTSYNSTGCVTQLEIDSKALSYLQRNRISSKYTL